jgi:hypothetical protein
LNVRGTALSPFDKLRVKSVIVFMLSLSKHDGFGHL